jgi:transcriptional regulator
MSVKALARMLRVPQHDTLRSKRSIFFYNMYTPSFNKFTNEQEAVVFMQRYSFATLVSVREGAPVATPLPFVIKYAEGKIKLLSHLAKANPQAENLTGQKVLVIFMEPHAYISPKNYEKRESVPTWNYIAVHAYGECVMLDSVEGKFLVLEETIKTYEADYFAQWSELSQDYKLKMMNGIIAFEILVDKMEARKKLSQEKPEQAKESIINNLSQSKDTLANDIAAYMAAEKKD